MYNYRVYNNLFWIFLTQMDYRLQSMLIDHMVGRAASVVSLYLPSIKYSLGVPFHYLLKVWFPTQVDAL